MILGTAVVYAFTITFSRFSPYDDEGRLMISVQGFLAGNPLYNAVGSSYGPVYYFYEWFVHALLRIPLTTDGTALLCVIHWIVAAMILGLAGYRLTKSLPLGIFVFAQAIVHLSALANEPGHPQELIVILRALGALLVAQGLESKLTLPGLGIIAGALVLTKINVGIFFGVALFLTLLIYSLGVQFRSPMFWLALIASAFLPFLLMRSHLTEQWAFDYSSQTSLSIFALGIVACSFIPERPLKVRAWLTCSFAGFATLVSSLLGVLFTGSTTAAVLKFLVVAPSKAGTTFCVPFDVPNGFWFAVPALLCAGAALILRNQQDKWILPISALKAFYGFLGTVLLLSQTGAQQAYLKPWVWLLLVGLNGEASTRATRFFPRAFLCFAAVFQGLQAYPVAGTQVAVGTFMLVLVCSMCLFDAFKVLVSQPWLHQRIPLLISGEGKRWVNVCMVFGLLELCVLKWCQPIPRWNNYLAAQPLGLRGAHYRRIESGRAAKYRLLAKSIERQCDTFIIVPGFNSLYFWTEKKPPTYFNISGENTLPGEEEQKLIIAALKQAKHALMIHRPLGWGGKVRGGELKDGPLSQFLRDECWQVGVIGEFQVCMWKGAAPVKGLPPFAADLAIEQVLQ